jgi:hypothetical protein
MKMKAKILLFYGLATVATITASYAACFAQLWGPVCVQAGYCYGQCTPVGCSQSTCLIATSTGYESSQSNTYPSGSGLWPARVWDQHTYNTCYVSACKLWNNCTQQYQYSPINGCSCNAQVPKYTPQEPAGCL